MRKQKVVKLVQGIICDGRECEKPLIPQGNTYHADEHGRYYCEECNQKPADDTLLAGALA